MYFYSDSAPKSTNRINLRKADAVGFYLKHFKNLLELEKISKALIDTCERMGVEKEISICKRKMGWWERQETFDLAECARAMRALRRG